MPKFTPVALPTHNPLIRAGLFRYAAYAPSEHPIPTANEYAGTTALTDVTADATPPPLARVMTYSNSAGSVTCVANRNTVRPSSMDKIFAARSA